MILSFRSRALKRFWEKGDDRRLPPPSIDKIALVLDTLDAASAIGEMDVQGFNLHALKGDRRGEYAVTVTHNWRITFRWQDGDAVDVDFLDYHEG
jgi:proteic killer suppression protein